MAKEYGPEGIHVGHVVVDGAVDGDKMAHLPAFEASWRKFYGKHADSRQAYNERAQRAIKPGKGIE